MHNCAEFLFEIAMPENVIGVCFFAMISCGVSVSNGDTKIVMFSLCCIRFLRKDKSTTNQDSYEGMVVFAYKPHNTESHIAYLIKFKKLVFLVNQIL